MTTAVSVDLRAPARLAIYLEQGTTGAVEVTVTDANGDPFDLTDYEITYQADTSTPITKTVSSGIAVDDPTTGVFEIEFEPEDTASLSIEGIQSFTHRCRIEGVDGDVYTLFRGVLAIQEA